MFTEEDLGRQNCELGRPPLRNEDDIEQSIRDVMAFPKNNRGMDLMANSPAEVEPRQLRDLSLKLAEKK